MIQNQRILYAMSFVVAFGGLLAVTRGDAAVPAMASTARLASPQSALDSLLAVDRAFSAASATTDLVTGISSMFAADVAMALPGGKFSTSSTEAVEFMKATPANLTSRAEWTPVRGGISADGTQGFTLGYVTIHKNDNTTSTGKYLSYWVKGSSGWRVAAYKRRPRADTSAFPTAIQTPALPPRMVPYSPDAARTEGFRKTLDAAERAFSDDAQKIGLSAAFAKWGTADSYNMGAQTDKTWVVGSVAIGKAVSAGEPTTGSSVYWAPDRVIIASSGDLGVTIGLVKLHTAPTDGSPAAFPFFTIWRRANATAPWHYVAE